MAGGSYLPAQAQQISIMRLRRVTEHVRSRNWTALGIEMWNEGADLPKCEAIARAVLRSIGALPPDSTPNAGKGNEYT